MRHITVVSFANLLSFEVLDHEISSWQCMKGVSFESLSVSLEIYTSERGSRTESFCRGKYLDPNHNKTVT